MCDLLYTSFPAQSRPSRPALASCHSRVANNQKTSHPVFRDTAARRVNRVWQYAAANLFQVAEELKVGADYRLWGRWIACDRPLLWRAFSGGVVRIISSALRSSGKQPLRLLPHESPP